jgi:hypothetical protein
MEKMVEVIVSPLFLVSAVVVSGNNETQGTSIKAIR